MSTKNKYVIFCLACHKWINYLLFKCVGFGSDGGANFAKKCNACISNKKRCRRVPDGVRVYL